MAWRSRPVRRRPDRGRRGRRVSSGRRVHESPWQERRRGNAAVLGTRRCRTVARGARLLVSTPSRSSVSHRRPSRLFACHPCVRSSAPVVALSSLSVFFVSFLFIFVVYLSGSSPDTIATHAAVYI